MCAQGLRFLLALEIKDMIFEIATSMVTCQKQLETVP